MHEQRSPEKSGEPARLDGATLGLLASPTTDGLILAALERAERHDARRGVSMGTIQDHLCLPRRSGAARQVRARVLAMTEKGILEHFRRCGIEIWALTKEGRSRLRQAGNVAESLPESPQHQRWRKARSIAERELSGLLERLRETVEQATAMLNEKELATSVAWIDASKRLSRDAYRVGCAIHCLREWGEPSDAVRDADDDKRYPGRRTLSLWDGNDERKAWP